MSNHDLYVLVSYLLIKIKFSLLTQVYIDLFRSECELSSSVYRAEELHSMSKLSIMPYRGFPMKASYKVLTGFICYFEGS